MSTSFSAPIHLRIRSFLPLSRASEAFCFSSGPVPTCAFGCHGGGHGRRGDAREISFQSQDEGCDYNNAAEHQPALEGHASPASDVPGSVPDVESGDRVASATRAFPSLYFSVA